MRCISFNRFDRETARTINMGVVFNSNVWTFRISTRDLKTLFLIIAVTSLGALKWFSAGTVESQAEKVNRSAQFDFKSIEAKLNDKGRCYVPHASDTLAYFPDILDDEQQPEPDNDIFFLETSCQSGVVTLNAK